MALELEKIKPVTLRSLNLNEGWLQARISEDPSILGLGDLEIAGKEHSQPTGGRIDFLMRNTEDEVFYEVEIMLGATDESHIMRTIEYWDIERQRRPQWDHRAVIVAEEITARFFNVLRLLNRAVPIIAIKLGAFQFGNKVVLHPVTVLDVLEEISDPEAVDPVERSDRTYWEKKSPTLLSMLDKLAALLTEAKLEPKITYNRWHIALGTSGRNFWWFHPRKAANTGHIEFRVAAIERDKCLEKLQTAGIDASPHRIEFGTFNVTTAAFEKNLAVLKDVLEQGEMASR